MSMKRPRAGKAVRLLIQKDRKGINEKGICEVCGHDTNEGEKLLGCVTIEHCSNLLALEREWWHTRFHRATGIPCDGTLAECKRRTPDWIYKAKFVDQPNEKAMKSAAHDRQPSGTKEGM